MLQMREKKCKTNLLLLSNNATTRCDVEILNKKIKYNLRVDWNEG